MKIYKNIEQTYIVTANTRISAKTYRMELSGDTSGITRAGQFVNLEIEGKYLRRPISVCDYDKERLLLLYDVVGSGTEILSGYREGSRINVLTGLGNGFNEDIECKAPVLLGGGIGCAPLLNLAKKLKGKGKDVRVVLGFNTASDIVMKEDLLREGIEPIICTVDGSAGEKGFVTDGMRNKGLEADYFYACGPMPMLRALCRDLSIPGEVSLESRMGCGFGACMCCSIETATGAKRICKDGPIFRKDELLWK